MGFLTNIYNSIKKQIIAEIEKSTAFVDVEITGKPEKTQPIPPKQTPKPAPKPNPPPTPTVDIKPQETSTNIFFNEMTKYANYNRHTESPFVPFQKYWPTYADMDTQQQNWYFHWRYLVRNGEFPNTDLSYIFVYVYELLSGIGWQKTSDGLDCLLTIWLNYNERFPNLDKYLQTWIFDFAYTYKLDYPNQLENTANPIKNYIVANAIIEKYAKLTISPFVAQTPLKLPFSVIITLCDYPILKSAFYNMGNQNFMQQTIPLILALLDKDMLQNTQNGILATYGPTTAKPQEHTLFSNALCHLESHPVSINLKPYATHLKLRKYISEVVKATENAIRDMQEYPKNRRLHLDLDQNTIKIIRTFLHDSPQKSEKPKNKTESPKPTEQIIEQIIEPTTETLNLNFEDIARLRKETEIIQAALWVENSEEVTETIANPPNKTTGTIENTKTTENIFETENLSEDISTFIKNLTIPQQQVIQAILTNNHQQIQQISETAETMPEIILDDINELAIETIGDIIIDSQSQTILEEFANVIKISSKK
ncbi:MAG: TerB N-terminal domain-containing protein [Firmicutes bacterium]|nr:TerB N-terminal domain-containing protein [Bacillota bacterium]